MTKISKRTVDAMPVKTKEHFIWDSELKGFGVRCSPKGKKTYVVQYRQKGRQRRMSLGQHGTLAPNEARDLARKNLGDVAHGEDPSGVRQQERRTPNMSALCDRFMEEHVRVKLKPRTQKEYQSIIDRHIRPRFGSLRIDVISRKDVMELHQAMHKIPTHANRARSILSKMFNLAELWELRPEGSNPTRLIPRYKEKPRERYLSPEEIRRLWRTLDARVSDGLESLQVASAYKLLLLTGCRLSEIKTLKWFYIQGNVIWLPDSKTGRRRVLLSDTALSVLDQIPRLPDNEHVIAGEVDGQHITDLQRPWQRIRKQARLDDVRIHDLRHTHASLAAAAGHSLPQIGYLLGHTQSQTTARYAHLEDASARQASNSVEALMVEFIGETESSDHQFDLRLEFDDV